MKALQLAVLVFISFGIVGCNTPLKQHRKDYAKEVQSITAHYKSLRDNAATPGGLTALLNTTGTNTSAGSTNLVRPEVVLQRLDTLERLKKKAAEVNQRLSLAFQTLTKQGEGYGKTKVALGVSGIAAGIAAAALTAASPANAVWVVVLAGYAGGIAGMNTLADTTGFSREAVVRVQQDTLSKIKEVKEGITFAALENLLYFGSNAEWEAKSEAVETSINSAEFLLFSLQIPSLGPAK